MEAGRRGVRGATVRQLVHTDDERAPAQSRRLSMVELPVSVVSRRRYFATVTVPVC